MNWSLVFKQKDKMMNETHRAKVPGGWLYRHRSCLIYKPGCDGNPEYPIQCVETMVFVPSVPRNKRESV